MVQRYELQPVGFSEAGKAIETAMGAFISVKTAKEQGILDAKIEAGRAIKAQLVELFKYLPEPQNKGICIELGFNNKQEDREGFGTSDAYTPGPWLQNSLVMYPDGLYLVPMVSKERRESDENHRGRYFAKCPLDLDRYVNLDLVKNTIEKIKANLVKQQPVLYTPKYSAVSQELMFAEVFPDDEVIELIDPARQTQLAAKREEYIQRLAGEWAGDYSHEMRVRILDILLRDGKVAISQLDDPDWHTSTLKYEEFEKAWLVIRQYAHSGGGNIIGGTGLSQANEVVNNWPILPPAR